MLRRYVQVLFRLTNEEYAELKKKVKKSGLSREAYIRTVLGGSMPKEPPPADYYAMMKELRAIGNRMNQIAARANATGFFLAEQYARDVKELRAAVLKIQEAVLLPERIKAEHGNDCNMGY